MAEGKSGARVACDGLRVVCEGSPLPDVVRATRCDRPAVPGMGVAFRNYCERCSPAVEHLVALEDDDG